MPFLKPADIATILFQERYRFVLWLPVFIGIGVGIYYTLDAEPEFHIAAAVTLALMVATWFSRKHFWLKMAGIAACAIAVGLLAATLRTQMVAAPYLYSTVYFKEVTGRIDDIEFREADQKLYLEQVGIEGIRPETTPQRVSIALKKPNPGLKVGDVIKVPAMLFPPPGPAMPGAYDFGRAFYYDRLGAVGYTPKEPQVVKEAGINSFRDWLNDLRLRVGTRIRANMNEEHGAVALALMVGEMSGVSEELRDAMRDSGLYHVLSISGLHMTLAVGVVYVALRFLLSLYMPLALRLPTKKIAAAGGLLGAFCYLLLAGYPVPAIRSFIMVACVMIAILCDRRGISLYSLAWAAILILLFQPEALVGSSFQLSFAATIAIVVLYESYGKLLYQSNRNIWQTVRVYFLGLMATSLVATLATTPLVIYQFNRMTLWGVFPNMLMMPLASLWIMPAAVLSFLSMPFGLEQWPLAVMEQGIGLMITLSRWFAALPYAAFNVPPLTHGGMLLVVFGGLWFALWEQRWRLLGLPLIFIGICSIALFKPYDLVVGEQGNRIMTRLEGGQYLFLRGKPDSFESELWLKAHGVDTALTLKDVKDMPGAPECDKNRCVLEQNGTRIIAGLRKDSANLCQPDADMVIFEKYLNDAACEKTPWRIDKAFLRANGAAAFRFGEGGMEIHVASEGRGGRPWGKNAYWPLYQRGTRVMIPQFKPAKDTP